MPWLGVVLIAGGAALLVAGHGDTLHSLGIAVVVVGAALVVLGAVRGVLRLFGLRNRLRYEDREDFSGGIPADYRTSRGKLAAVALVLLYLFSPLDLAVLELLLPVGVVGDTGAVAWLVFTTGKEVTRHRQARKLRKAGRAAIR